MNGDDPRSPPRAPSRVSAAQLKALKRFGAVQVLSCLPVLPPACNTRRKYMLAIGRGHADRHLSPNMQASPTAASAAKNSLRGWCASSSFT